LRKKWFFGGFGDLSCFVLYGSNGPPVWIWRLTGRVYRKIKNSISVPSHPDAIFSLRPSLQALLENVFSPKPAFLKQGAGT
jgi:hypothetical protein